ncbi:MAG: hypothetical protein C4574_00660 [Candidatus Latescibacterota bacterium]|jgi:hypothetical protein|nr:MAG: hypothetical protein C4574_00660 [Candidatus Latescibacterota bacterium]
MISIFKDYLKTLVLAQTTIPDGKIYLNVKEEGVYKLAPWASILSQNARIVPVMKKEPNFQKEMRIRKYDVFQPIVLAVCGKTEAEADGWMNAILDALAPYAVLEHSTGLQHCGINPGMIEYSDTSTIIRGNAVADVELEFQFSVFCAVDDLEAYIPPVV